MSDSDRLRRHDEATRLEQVTQPTTVTGTEKSVTGNVLYDKEQGDINMFPFGALGVPKLFQFILVSNPPTKQMQCYP